MPSCAVCGRTRNKRSKEKKITFHRFPRYPVILKKWDSFLKATISKKINRFSLICSEHFEPKCFNDYKKTKSLNRDAVPSIIVNRIKSSQNTYPHPEVFIDFKDPDVIPSEPIKYDTNFDPEPKIQTFTVICDENAFLSSKIKVVPSGSVTPSCASTEVNDPIVFPLKQTSPVNSIHNDKQLSKMSLYLQDNNIQNEETFTVICDENAFLSSKIKVVPSGNVTPSCESTEVNDPIVFPSKQTSPVNKLHNDKQLSKMSVYLQDNEMQNEENECQDDLFDLIMKNILSVNLPKNWFICTERLKNEDVICFHKLSPLSQDFSRHIEKQLFITIDSSIILFLNGKKVSLQDAGLNSDELDSVESFQVFLHDVNEIKCCRGASPPLDFFKLKKSFGFGHSRFSRHFWHKNCSTVISDDNEDNLCLWCKHL